ncbi:MAG TPA: histidine kinase, partial [Polyangiaceae bacterium]|nr:histidine kinase [Polyangiaceae bacterium]
FLTLILAFRPSESSGGGVERIAELRRLAEPCAPARIELESLDEDDINALCEHFASPCRDAERLSAFVCNGARGNPLFALEILKRLVQTGDLHWAREGTGGSWRLLATRAERIPASANVVDFIIGRIDALPEPCRKVLTAASCIGHAFGFSELRVATELTAPELMRAVDIVCAEGLVTPEPTGPQKSAEPIRGSSSSKRSVLRYSFFHDRIQQAAYSLCSGDERQRIHLAVGRTRLRAVTGSGRSLFPAIEHLNRVHELLSPEEQRQLADHNFRAGVAAKESVAYATAITLFRLALNALSDARGQRAQRLLFQCHLQLAECLYLNAEFAEAEAAFLVALESARTLVDEVEVQRTRLVLYQHMQRYAEAISLGLATLKKLGVRMPEKPGTVGTLSRLAPVMLRARRTPAEELFERPDHAEQTDRMILDLLVLLWTPSFWVNQSLNALVVLKLIEVTLRLGNTPQAPMAYVCFGILHHVVFKQHERGLSFGRLAYRLVEDGADPFIASRVRFLALTFFGPLERDNRENVAIYERALAKCLESGEHVFAGHTLDGISTSLPIHGFRIPEIERRLGVCDNVAERIGSDASRELVRVVRAFCRALVEHPNAPSASIDDRAIRYDSYLGVHRLLRMVVCYLWDRDDDVRELAKALRGNQVVQSNPLHASFYSLFSVLAAARSPKGFQKRVARRMLARLARFDSIQSQNFKSMLLLATAELQLREGHSDAALDSYHRAVSESAERGHDLVHALSCERLAALFEARGDTASHHEYLAVAAYAYERFGATGKLRQLAQKYPNMRLERSGAEVAASTLRATELDAEALMRAAYAIAEETRSDRLTENLLRVITTTAGGERGLLLKPNDADWNVVAEWRTNQPRPDLLGGVLVPESVIRYVARTKGSVRLHGSELDPRFRSDPYFQDGNAPSALCLPLMHRGEVSAVLYLENGLCADVFTDAQQRLATMLGHQAAIAMAIADYHKVQMDALQAKINPHFLYNALSVIAELVQKEPAKAESAVLKLSKLYRYVLSSSAEQVVTLEQELGIVRDYLVLEQHRFGEKLKVEFSVTGATGNVRLPALIFQPLVENSVRHGIARKLGPGCVKVTVSVGDSECCMRVEDDGPGWSGSGRKGGFGVRSVRERLALLYGGEGELTIQKSPSVVAELRIPLDVVSRRAGPSSSARSGAAASERGASERSTDKGISSRDGERLQEVGEA